jgi:hypothetical protein
MYRVQQTVLLLITLSTAALVLNNCVIVGRFPVWSHYDESPASVHASCATMQVLAQEHANDMARRGSMDHAGFMDRARRGARAENVAYGLETKQQAIALWWGSSGHAANMRLPGCKAVASAVGHNGTRYWAMVIGN